MRNTQLYKYTIEQCAEFYLDNNIYEPTKINQCFSGFIIQFGFFIINRYSDSPTGLYDVIPSSNPESQDSIESDIIKELRLQQSKLQHKNHVQSEDLSTFNSTGEYLYQIRSFLIYHNKAKKN